MIKFNDILRLEGTRPSRSPSGQASGREGVSRRSPRSGGRIPTTAREVVKPSRAARPSDVGDTRELRCHPEASAEALHRTVPRRGTVGRAPRGHVTQSLGMTSAACSSSRSAVWTSSWSTSVGSSSDWGEARALGSSEPAVGTRTWWRSRTKSSCLSPGGSTHDCSPETSQASTTCAPPGKGNCEREGRVLARRPKKPGRDTSGQPSARRPLGKVSALLRDGPRRHVE